MALNKQICALLMLLLSTFAAAQNPSTTVTVNASANRHAIDPRVYGTAHASAAMLSDLNIPLNRSGGNNTTRYNWQLNADNRAADWYYESISQGNAVAGELNDTFFSNSKSAGADAMLTIPMIGWVAKLGPSRSKLSSFSISKYGAQCDADFDWFEDAGNGYMPDCVTPITSNDPNDANVPADANFQKGWVQHLVNKWGNAASGGLKYYILDNEYSLWYDTHRDVHPAGPHMTEIRDKIVQYGAMIKSVDSAAVVVGPEEWGWTGYLYTGYDMQWADANGWSNTPDRIAMGNMDHMPWLLGQLKQSAVNTGIRPIDVFTLHYYPQQNEFSNRIDNTTQLQRNRSTRSLWDPSYVDTSWIGDVVKLIPRMRSWVNTYYFAGTPIGITEYNWGAENHINGATTQADILGIFGREGLDMAARWTTPASTTPTYKAMKMYRNYDGAKSTFGDTSVSTQVANPDNLSAFSALRNSDGALTIMVINKVLSGNTPLTLALSNFAGNGVAKAYQLINTNAITQLANISYSGNSLSATLPPQSITLFVLAPAKTHDFNSDGKSDIIVEHSNGSVIAWLMNGTSPSSGAYLLGAGSGWSVIDAKGDYNADGKADLLIKHTDGSVQVWLMNGTTPTAAYLLNAGSGWSVDQIADLNGDGKSDIIVKHSNGSVLAWLMNGTAPSSGAYLLGAGSGWSIIDAKGDYNGDGKADLLIKHTDGSVQVWLMNGTTPTAAYLLNAGSGWSIDQIADLNGDGKSDIIVKHSNGSVLAWLMNGTSPSSGAYLLGAGSGWSVLDVKGDYNGDGKADLLIKHTDGSVQVWLMNGTTPTAAYLLNASSGWSIDQIADLNGDGKSDIIIKHSNGSVLAWLMNGTSPSSGAYLLGAGSGWSVLDVKGDYNGDGKADLLIKHTDGSVQVWLMNGTTPTAAYLLGAGSGWSVLP